MKPGHRLPWLVGGLAALMTTLALGSVAAVWTTLAPGDRAFLAGVLAARVMLVVMIWLAVFGVLAWCLARAFRHWIEVPAQLNEQAQALVASGTASEVVAHGSAANRGLAESLNALAQQRTQLRDDVAAQVAQASLHIDEERGRLSALMAELTQAVLVCNRDGLVVLYNQRARALFRSTATEAVVADGTELIGLGRSIHAVVDRALLDHAWHSLETRLRAGVQDATAQFVISTRSGVLLRVQMAAVRQPGGSGNGVNCAGSGFVLMLDDITREVEQERLRDRLLLGLTEGSRASLGNLQAALEVLELPDLEVAMRERLQRVVREEVATMTARVHTLADDVQAGMKTRWPLEDMRGADLVSAALRRIESMATVSASADEVDEALWLRVDSYHLPQALAWLVGRLADECAVRHVRLRLHATGARAQLDLLWTGAAISAETAMHWQGEDMRSGADGTLLTVRDVVERHGGECWFERGPVLHEAFFRFLLPCADGQAPSDLPQAVSDGARHEFYDFDLFQTSARMPTHTQALDDRPLAELSYTVFDTETTGLNPSEGDEIIQIGATRIVNGRLLRGECLEQLVDPHRPVSAAAMAIHGIPPASLAGQPDILQVLPVFHRFASDTVLVAHNAAFDMRFLQLKQAASGVCFDQPVLDTLLLSAWVHPNQASHALDAIAQRLGVAVSGRHTALGDALVTAEVFLKLMPLLQAQGVRTLGQARAAALQTSQAQLRY